MNMKNIFALILCSVLSINTTHSQSFEMDGSEIGFDIAFSASTNGGNAGSDINLSLGRRADAAVDSYTNGNIGPIHIYNRALSSTEVLHNYNALKGRFS